MDKKKWRPDGWNPKDVLGKAYEENGWDSYEESDEQKIGEAFADAMLEAIRKRGTHVILDGKGAVYVHIPDDTEGL